MEQIPLLSTVGNVQRTVWRICILILKCKGLNWQQLLSGHEKVHHWCLRFSAKVFFKSNIYSKVTNFQDVALSFHGEIYSSEVWITLTFLSHNGRIVSHHMLCLQFFGAQRCASASLDGELATTKQFCKNQWKLMDGSIKVSAQQTFASNYKFRLNIKALFF